MQDSNTRQAWQQLQYQAMMRCPPHTFSGPPDPKMLIALHHQHMCMIQQQKDAMRNCGGPGMYLSRDPGMHAGFVTLQQQQHPLQQQQHPLLQQQHPLLQQRHPLLLQQQQQQHSLQHSPFGFGDAAMYPNQPILQQKLRPSGWGDESMNRPTKPGWAESRPGRTPCRINWWSHVMAEMRRVESPLGVDLDAEDDKARVPEEWERMDAPVEITQPDIAEAPFSFPPTDQKPEDERSSLEEAGIDPSTSAKHSQDTQQQQNPPESLQQPYGRPASYAAPQHVPQYSAPVREGDVTDVVEHRNYFVGPLRPDRPRLDDSDIIEGDPHAPVEANLGGYTPYRRDHLQRAVARDYPIADTTGKDKGQAQSPLIDSTRMVTRGEEASEALDGRMLLLPALPTSSTHIVPSDEEATERSTAKATQYSSAAERIGDDASLPSTLPTAAHPKPWHRSFSLDNGYFFLNRRRKMDDDEESNSEAESLAGSDSSSNRSSLSSSSDYSDGSHLDEEKGCSVTQRNSQSPTAVGPSILDCSAFRRADNASTECTSTLPTIHRVANRQWSTGEEAVTGPSGPTRPHNEQTSTAASPDHITAARIQEVKDVPHENAGGAGAHSCTADLSRVASHPQGAAASPTNFGVRASSVSAASDAPQRERNQNPPILRESLAKDEALPTAERCGHDERWCAAQRATAPRSEPHARNTEPAKKEGEGHRENLQPTGTACGQPAHAHADLTSVVASGSPIHLNAQAAPSEHTASTNEIAEKTAHTNGTASVQTPLVLVRCHTSPVAGEGKQDPGTSIPAPSTAAIRDGEVSPKKTAGGSAITTTTASCHSLTCSPLTPAAPPSRHSSSTEDSLSRGRTSKKTKSLATWSNSDRPTNEAPFSTRNPKAKGSTSASQAAASPMAAAEENADTHPAIPSATDKKKEATPVSKRDTAPTGTASITPQAPGDAVPSNLHLQKSDASTISAECAKAPGRVVAAHPTLSTEKVVPRPHAPNAVAPVVAESLPPQQVSTASRSRSSISQEAGLSEQRGVSSQTRPNSRLASARLSLIPKTASPNGSTAVPEPSHPVKEASAAGAVTPAAAAPLTSKAGISFSPESISTYSSKALSQAKPLISSSSTSSKGSSRTASSVSRLPPMDHGGRQMPGAGASTSMASDAKSSTGVAISPQPPHLHGLAKVPASSAMGCRVKPTPCALPAVGSNGSASKTEKVTKDGAPHTVSGNDHRTEEETS